MGRKKDPRYEDAVRLYESGMSVGDVAEFYGVSRQNMWTRLKLRGAKFRSNLRYGGDNHFFRGGAIDDQRVHAMFTKAVAKKRLAKSTKCEECGVGGRIEGHHDDYNKPLSVRWLCHDCHFSWHKSNVPIARTIELPAMPRSEYAAMGGREAQRRKRTPSKGNEHD